ncbi:MAG: mechanosensitive ion channel family protein [Gaiellaceae bacterium]
MTARLIATAVVVGATLLLAWIIGAVAGRRGHDAYSTYHFRKLARYLVVLAGIVALLIIWRESIGHLALFGGLVVAGLAFAMQEAVGAVAGWFNIVSGGIYRVGDRVELGGVKGDVLDITPLRTKILEMGSSLTDEPTWVGGRQYTGRIVTISNKATFEQPTYNYSAFFEFVWEEMKVPVPYRADWRRAEQILREEAERVSATEGARKAIDLMMQRYPIPKHEVDARVYVTLTDNWVELAARFVIPVRESRSVRDRLARAVRDRFDAEGIEVASSTMDVAIYGPKSG